MGRTDLYTILGLLIAAGPTLLAAQRQARRPGPRDHRWFAGLRARLRTPADAAAHDGHDGHGGAEQAGRVAAAVVDALLAVLPEVLAAHVAARVVAELDARYDDLHDDDDEEEPAPPPTTAVRRVLPATPAAPLEPLPAMPPAARAGGAYDSLAAEHGGTVGHPTWTGIIYGPGN